MVDCLSVPETALMHTTHTHTNRKAGMEVGENGKRWRQRYKQRFCPLSNAVRA